MFFLYFGFFKINISFAVKYCTKAQNNTSVTNNNIGRKPFYKVTMKENYQIEIDSDEFETINKLVELSYGRLAGNGHNIIPYPYYPRKKSWFERFVNFFSN